MLAFNYSEIDKRTKRERFNDKVNPRLNRVFLEGPPFISGKKDNSKTFKRSSSDGLIYCQNATM